MPSSALDSLRDFNKGRRQFRKVGHHRNCCYLFSVSHFCKIYLTIGLQGLVGIVASQMYMRNANRVTLLESDIEEIRNVFSKFSDDPASCTELDSMGQCTLPVMSLAAAMKALGEDITPHDAMKLALTGDAVDMQVRLVAPFSLPEFFQNIIRKSFIPTGLLEGVERKTPKISTS